MHSHQEGIESLELVLEKVLIIIPYMGQSKFLDKLGINKKKIDIKTLSSQLL